MRCTEEIVPTSHSGIRVISPSVKLSNWTATLEPSLRVGSLKVLQADGRWAQKESTQLQYWPGRKHAIFQPG